MWCTIADARYTRYVPNFVCLDMFILSRSVGEKPKFCRFWTPVFTDVANWQQSVKVDHGYTTTNLPLSNGIKIVFFSTPTDSWRNRTHKL